MTTQNRTINITRNSNDVSQIGVMEAFKPHELEESQFDSAIWVFISLLLLFDFAIVIGYFMNMFPLQIIISYLGAALIFITLHLRSNRNI